MLDISMAGKYLKPYQGLKPSKLKDLIKFHCRAGKYLKPYQGLKRKD